MLPNNLSYNNNVEAAASKSFRSNIQPISGSVFKSGETVSFNIPTRANLCMSGSESYFRGKLSFKNGATASDYIRLDSCGVAGAIYRISVYHGSNLLEQVEQYGLLNKLLMDLQHNTSSNNGKNSILLGTSTEYTTDRSTFIAGATDAASIAALKLASNSSKYLNAGRKLNSLYSVAIAAAETVSIDFCIPLVSLVGTLSSKYIPLWKMTSAPLRIEITLASNPLDVVCAHKALATDGNAMLVSDVEFVASMMELSDSSISIIESNTGGKPLQYTVSSWKNFRYSNQINGRSSTQLTFPIPCKVASLKSIFILQKRVVAGSNILYFPMNSEKLYLSQYNFRVGPNLIPSKPPTLVSEFFSEALKAIGSLSDLSHSPSIDYETYSVDVTGVTTETLTQAPTIGSSSFYIGIDMENYSGADKNQLFAGYNSSTDDIYFNGVYNPGSATGLADSLHNVVLDAFCVYDQVLIFENGTAYVKY